MTSPLATSWEELGDFTGPPGPPGPPGAGGADGSDADVTAHVTATDPHEQYAYDAAVVHNTGAETIAGEKRFADNTDVDGFLYLAKSSSLTRGVLRRDTIEALIAAADATVVHRAGTETITGSKEFSTPPLIPIGNLPVHPVRRDDPHLVDERDSPAAKANQPDGWPKLDASGLLATSVLPPVALIDVFPVDTEEQMLALTAQPGDVAIRVDLRRSFMLRAAPASTLANWQELVSPTDAVTSVNGRVGVVSGLAEQTAVDAITAARGASNGLCPLDGNARVPTANSYAASPTQRGVVQLTGDLAGSSTAPIVPRAHSHAGLWEADVYGDLCSNGHRDDATATWAFSAANRTVVLLLGVVPAGSYAGFRLFRTAAMVGGVAAAALYSAPTRASTSWARLGAGNVAPVFTATGQLDVALPVTLPADALVALVITLTTAPTTYPTVAATPVSPAALLNGGAGAAVAGASGTATAPAATMNPTTGLTAQTQKPWAALF